MNSDSGSDRPFAVPPTTARVIAYVPGFQAAWFACVLGAAHELLCAGTTLAAVIFVSSLGYAARPLQELKLLAVALLIGLIWDSLMVTLGWLDFRSGFFIDGMATHWILALWALFAITVNLSLAWLKSRLPVAALMGAIAGPLAFWGGARLGAVALLEPLPAFLARRFNGIAARG